MFCIKPSVKTEIRVYTILQYKVDMKISLAYGQDHALSKILKMMYLIKKTKNIVRQRGGSNCLSDSL